MNFNTLSVLSACPPRAVHPTPLGSVTATVGAMTEVVVITGMSGAGRTQAGNALEDLGWFVIDNLPPAFISKVAELAQGPRSQTSKVALIMGAIPGYDEVVEAFDQLRAAGSTVRVVFLDASTDVLVRRYESTKRRHPQAGDDSLLDAIERERAMLRPIRETADLVIDTSGLTIYDLRARVHDLVGADAGQGMTISVMSFGYKHGLPGDVDVVIDCRFLPNPYWVESLRPLSGLDQPVRDYLDDQELTAPFLERLTGLLELLVPAYREEGKAYLTIALGCTGGRHRSVAVAEEVAAFLRRGGDAPRVLHRDIDK